VQISTLTPAGPHAKPGQGNIPADLPSRADQLLTVMASLRRSGRLLARRPDEFATLTDAQVDLVSLVLHRPGVSVAQAAEALRLAPNTVSTLVRQLTDAQMLVRRVDQQDRRVARLELTTAMQRKVAAFRDRRVETLSSAIRRLSAADQQLLVASLAVLDRLAETLQRQEVPDA
jgi:DNA-binding MarR family transcriptional regulator